MTLRAFIAANRDDLQAAVARVLGRVPRQASCYCPRSGTEHDHDVERLSVAELGEWIANDEGLYSWARSEGVRI
jgi:hypothetical protein